MKAKLPLLCPSSFQLQAPRGDIESSVPPCAGSRAVHRPLASAFTGPEPGQERKISRPAKLSQSETRFVSYVTLFAATDAYLSSLPEEGAVGGSLRGTEASGRSGESPEAFAELAYGRHCGVRFKVIAELCQAYVGTVRSNAVLQQVQADGRGVQGAVEVPCG